MSVLQTLTSIAKALIPWNPSTRERTVKVYKRLEGSVENIDRINNLITIRKAREQNAKRIVHVSNRCKITQMGEPLRLDHLNLYDHICVIFKKVQGQCEAVDIEVLS